MPITMDLVTVRALWPNGLDDDLLQFYLDTAEVAVAAFASDSTDSNAYFLAKVMHARNLFNAARASSTTGDLGDGTYAIPQRPLDWHVRQLLRPTPGSPLVG